MPCHRYVMAWRVIAEQARNQPLVLKKMMATGLDANALDDWADDDDDDLGTDIDAFGGGNALDTFDGIISSSGGAINNNNSNNKAAGGWASGGRVGLPAAGAPVVGSFAALGGGGGLSDSLSVATSGVGRSGAGGGAGHGGEGGVIGMEATVLRRFMEDEDEGDAFDEMDLIDDGPLLPAGERACCCCCRGVGGGRGGGGGGGS